MGMVWWSEDLHVEDALTQPRNAGSLFCRGAS